MNNFADFVTNTNNWAAMGFQASPTWPYATPASVYFWAGFCFVFALCLFAMAIRWLNRIFGAVREE